MSACVSPFNIITKNDLIVFTYQDKFIKNTFHLISIKLPCVCTYLEQICMHDKRGLVDSDAYRTLTKSPRSPHLRRATPLD